MFADARLGSRRMCRRFRWPASGFAARARMPLAVFARRHSRAFVWPQPHSMARPVGVVARHERPHSGVQCELSLLPRRECCCGRSHSSRGCGRRGGAELRYRPHPWPEAARDTREVVPAPDLVVQDPDVRLERRRQRPLRPHDAAARGRRAEHRPEPRQRRHVQVLLEQRHRLGPVLPRAELERPLPSPSRRRPSRRPRARSARSCS